MVCFSASILFLASSNLLSASIFSLSFSNSSLFISGLLTSIFSSLSNSSGFIFPTFSPAVSFNRAKSISLIFSFILSSFFVISSNLLSTCFVCRLRFFIFFSCSHLLSSTLFLFSSSPHLFFSNF